MMRWKPGLVGLVLLAAAPAGCKQQLFLEPCDKGLLVPNLPKHLEDDPHAPIFPGDVRTPAPTTILDPDRPVRYLSLSEAIAIALEQGTIGQGAAVVYGGGPTNVNVNDDLVNSFGDPSSINTIARGDDSIRAFALNPAIVGNEIEKALAKFDTTWVTSATWTKRDDAVPNVLQNFNNGDLFSLNSALFKPMPTGGVAGITLSTDYTRLTQPPSQQFQVINPAYRPRLQASIEQPLLRSYGVEINQLINRHPGSRLAQSRELGRATTPDGILIARLRYDSQRVEFCRLVNQTLVNVETAYWGLYGAYYTLYAREQGLRQAFRSYREVRTRFEAGAINRQTLAQTRGQFELFRSQRLTALGVVLEQERALRNFLGLPIEDGYRLVPADTPTRSPFQPDWQSSLNEALTRRPELTLMRQDLKLRQLDLIIQKNELKPDLRSFATYDINGIGTELDGPTENNALRSLSNNIFNTWQIGLVLDVPIGFRDASALVRTSRLNLARTFIQLKNQERKAEFALARAYRALAENYEQILIQQAQREAYADELQARYDEVRVGRSTLGDNLVLQAQRNYSDSLAAEAQAVVNYQTSLAAFQYVKGTIKEYDNVMIADGPLPACVQVRATEHLKERTAAVVLRERPASDFGKHPADDPPIPGLDSPAVPGAMGGAPLPSLPAMQFGPAPVLPPPVDGERLPLPRPAPMPGMGLGPAMVPGAMPPTVPMSGPTPAGVAAFDPYQPPTRPR